MGGMRENRLFECVSTIFVDYLGCELSLDGEPDFDQKKKTDSKEYVALLENT